MKLLIVDDEELLRLTSYDIIEDSGYFSEEDIFVAEDGVLGYELYQKIKPDIILTDIRMPNMDGSEMIKKIRETDKKTEIIVMTGYADLDMAVEVIHQDVYELLRKPFQPPELVLVIERIFEKIKSLENMKAMESRLQDSEKLASVGLLSAGVAHEINNPNTFVKGNLELLQRYVTIVKPHLEKVVESGDEGSEKVKVVLDSLDGTLESAIKGSKRIAKIVASLLSFSRSSSSENVKSLSPGPCIDEAVTLTQFRHKKHDFKMEISENLKEIKLNEQEYVQIIMNFIVNATDAIEERYTEGGKGNLKLTISDLPDEKMQRLNFQDDGNGMSDETQRKIFDPFFTTKPQGKGTGLGLSMCFGIIADIHGKIECQSTVGQGTEFQIDIPWA